LLNVGEIDYSFSYFTCEKEQKEEQQAFVGGFGTSKEETPSSPFQRFHL